MLRPAINNQDAVFLGKALQGMLSTAFSYDNFEPFLKKSLGILAGSSVIGPGAKLGVTLKAGRVRSCFRGFSAADRARLLAGDKPEGARAGLYFTEPICLGNARAGRLSVLLKKPAASRLVTQSLLGMVAQFVSARLQGEQRDAELSRERDISYSVKHIEELYLSFPGISLEEISRAVMDEARRLTGSEFGISGYLSEDRKNLIVSAMTRESMTVPPPPGQQVILDSGLGLIGCVIRTKKPLISNRAQSDRRGARKLFSKVQRFLGVPAILDRRLVGVLTVANPKGDYTRVDLETVEKLARVYAMILQRKLAEDKQKEEDSRFRAIVSSTRDVIYTVGMNGRLTYVSPRAADYGYTPEELIGRSITDLAHEEDKEFLAKAFANTTKTGKTLPIVPYRIRRKDGSYSYVEQKSGVVVKDGAPAFVTGVVRDVSEQRKTEQLLKESEALMRMVFDTARDAIFLKDMNGIYVKVNKAFAELFLLEPEDILGGTDSDFFPKELVGAAFKEDSEVARTGKTLSFTRHRSLPSGSYYFNTVKTPMRNFRGEVIGVLGISRDVSELKKMESELAVARAEEAVSNVARPMAHDFNNALAAINGYATLIEDDLKPDSPIKTEISRIIEAVKRAAELTSKFQDFARNPKIENPGGAGDKKHEKK
jgi:PAS domain S-box-containing protein